MKRSEAEVVQNASSTLTKYRREIDEYYETMKLFPQMSPHDALVHLAGMSARVSEMRNQIVRMPANRSTDKMRTQEVDFFLTECDRQFKIWSRLITVAKFEHDLTRGL